MLRRISTAILILAAAAILQRGRASLSDVENKPLEAWPSEIIFGFYFAVLTLSIGALQKLVSRPKGQAHNPILMLLVLISLCLDLVLNNIFETVSHPGASYGLMILWDAMTFFIWLRIIELCVEGDAKEFNASLLIMVAPLFKFGREILSLPYSQPAVRAYLDLLFGDALVCLWIFIPECGPVHSRSYFEKSGRTVFRFAVLTGCLYWFMTAIENLLFLAWPPLQVQMNSIFKNLNVATATLNYAYFVAGCGLSLLIGRANVFGLGLKLGFPQTRRHPGTTSHRYRK